VKVNVSASLSRHTHSTVKKSVDFLHVHATVTLYTITSAIVFHLNASVLLYLCGMRLYNAPVQIVRCYCTDTNL
jgi:hypothetical protein